MKKLVLILVLTSFCMKADAYPKMSKVEQDTQAATNKAMNFIANFINKTNETIGVEVEFDKCPNQKFNIDPQKTYQVKGVQGKPCCITHLSMGYYHMEKNRRGVTSFPWAVVLDQSDISWCYKTIVINSVNSNEPNYLTW